MLTSLRCSLLCIRYSAAGPGPEDPTTFCNAFEPAYGDNGCCPPSTDQSLQSQFDGLAFSGPPGANVTGCRRLVQKNLCAVCDSWSAHLFNVEASAPRVLPTLCLGDWCSQVYGACANVAIVDSPFQHQWDQIYQSAAAVNQPYNATATTLASLWPDLASFASDVCASPSVARCYSGVPYDLDAPLPPAPPP
eukprot:SM006189S19843  [mRNA]  locus=s6189:2:837:- [translate_table: standard]